MKLRIYKEVKTRVPARDLQRLFDLIVAREAGKKWCADVNLIFTNDRTIRKLNDVYRGKDKATDVLSFNVDDPSLDGGTFGELYISCETAIRQATEYDASPSEEYLRLTCHGLLHLFGYDHIRRSDAVIMQKQERRYLKRLSEGAE